MCTDFTKHIYIIQIHQPIRVVDQHCLVLTELDEAAHLFLEALNVMVDRLSCHHLTHVGTSGWISDHGGSATDQSDRLVSCHLKSLHQAECHKVSYVQTVCSRIKSDVEYGFAVVDQFFDFFFVGYLRDQTAGN